MFCCNKKEQSHMTSIENESTPERYIKYKQFYILFLSELADTKKIQNKRNNFNKNQKSLELKELSDGTQGKLDIKENIVCKLKLD